MSHIGQHYLPYPDRVSFEAQRFNNSSVTWVSGEQSTWKYKIQSPFLVKSGRERVSFGLPTVYKLSRRFNKKGYQPLSSEWSKTAVTTQKFIKSSDVGFTKYLRVIGVGYKFIEDNPSELQVQVGFTHLLKQPIHPLFKIKSTRKKRMIRVKSISFSELTNSLACLRNKRKPNVFTGKGLRFRKQKVWRKTGKKKRN